MMNKFTAARWMALAIVPVVHAAAALTMAHAGGLAFGPATALAVVLALLLAAAGWVDLIRDSPESDPGSSAAMLSLVRHGLTLALPFLLAAVWLGLAALTRGSVAVPDFAVPYAVGLFLARAALERRHYKRASKHIDPHERIFVYYRDYGDD